MSFKNLKLCSVVLWANVNALFSCHVMLSFKCYIWHCQKTRGLASHKTSSTHHFVLKLSCTKLRKWQLFLIVRVCVCCTVSCFLLHFSVSVFRCFPLIGWCVSLGFSLLPGFDFSNRCMTFEQRYTTVVFI